MNLNNNNKWQHTLTSDYWTGTPTSMSANERQQAFNGHQRQSKLLQQDFIARQESIVPLQQVFEQDLSKTMISSEPMKSLDLIGDLDEDDYAVPNDEQCCRLERSQVELVQLIGEGQKGFVFLGKLQSRDGRQMLDVAIKTLKYETDQLIERLMSEAAMMRSLEHPHIIRFIGMCPETPALIAMELAKFGEIKQYLKLNRHLIRCSQLVLFTFQISTALSYLESKNFVHRDVAARNVLVCSHQCVKLADFGLSRNLLQQRAAQMMIVSNVNANMNPRDQMAHEARLQDKANLLSAQDDEQAHYVAAPRVKLPVRWLAPESLVFRRFTSASDVWMFAVCAWELLEWGQARPWPQLRNSQVLAAIEAGRRLARPEACPARLYQLMLQCWSYTPVQRPKFREIKQSIWSIYLRERTREQLEFERTERPLLLERQLAACTPQAMVLGAAERDEHQQQQQQAYYSQPPPDQSSSTTDESEGATTSATCSPVGSRRRRLNTQRRETISVSPLEALIGGDGGSGSGAAPLLEAQAERHGARLRAAALEAASRRFDRPEQRRQSQQARQRPGQLRKQRSQGAIVARTSSSELAEEERWQQRHLRGHDDALLNDWRRRQARAEWRRSQPPGGATGPHDWNRAVTPDEEEQQERDESDDACELSSFSKERLELAKQVAEHQKRANALSRLERSIKQAWQPSQQLERLVSASPALTQTSDTGGALQPTYEGLAQLHHQQQQPVGRVAMLRAPSGSPALLGVRSATGSVSPSLPSGGSGGFAAPSSGARPTSWRGQQQPQRQGQSDSCGPQLGVAKQPTTHELGQVLHALRLSPMKAKLKGPAEQSVRVLAPVAATEPSFCAPRRSPIETDANNNNNKNPKVEAPQNVNDTARLAQEHQLKQQQEQLQLHQRLLNSMIKAPAAPASVGAGSGSAGVKAAAKRHARATETTVDQSLQILQSLMAALPSLSGVSSGAPASAHKWRRF